MISILAVIHLILCVLVIILVLIQDPKGGASGGIFGGGGGADSLFGATGAPSFLAKLTRYVAIIFAVSCIAMTIATKPSGSSVLDSATAPKIEAGGGVSQDKIPESAPVGTDSPAEAKDQATGQEEVAPSAPTSREGDPVSTSE